MIYRANTSTVPMKKRSTMSGKDKTVLYTKILGASTAAVKKEKIALGDVFCGKL